jgi:protein-S-isoprenylcysteine O-methyltransferase
MFIFDFLFFIFWIIFFVYWIVSAKEIKPDQKVSWKAGGIGWQIGVVVAFLLLSQMGPLLPFRNNLAKIVAVLLVFAGMYIAIWARSMLGENWSKDVALKQGQQLVRIGAYRLIRHPIYSGYMLMLLGTVIYFNKYSLVILCVILSYFLIYKLKQEEELLSKEFPSGYKRYKQRTKRLIPFIW